MKRETPCPAPDASDEAASSPRPPSDEECSDWPGSCADATARTLLQLQSSASNAPMKSLASLPRSLDHLSQAILTLAQAIAVHAQAISAPSDPDGGGEDEEDDTPTVGLDGEPIPRRGGGLD